MSSALLINPLRRRQPYLVNPVNPPVWIDYPARRTKLFRYAEGTFGAPKMKKHPFLKVAKKLTKKAKRTLRKAVTSKARKAHKKVHKAVKRRVARKAVRRHIRRAVSKPRISPIKAVVVAKLKTVRRIKTMAKRKSRRAHRSHRNPFSLQNMTKGMVSTELLLDGSLVAGGMVASKFVMDFAASKMAFMANPIAKIVGRVVLGSVVIMGKKFIGGDKYAKPLAIGFIAPAVLDVVTMVVPANLLPAGGVKMEAGYLPDIAPSQVSLEQGYMPDVADQSVSFGFSGE